MGWLEARYEDDAVKNELCRPVPFPDRPEDLPAAILANMRNEGAWKAAPELREWLKDSRLDGFMKLVMSVDKADIEKQEMLLALRKVVPEAAANLQKLAKAA